MNHLFRLFFSLALLLIHNTVLAVEPSSIDSDKVKNAKSIIQEQGTLNESIKPKFQQTKSDKTKPKQKKSAEQWLAELSQALTTKNFTTSFLVIKNRQTELYHWFHGLDDEQKSFEILTSLNGPQRDVLRKDNVVSYIEQQQAPYSVHSNRIKGPVPTILSGDVKVLLPNYEFILMGKTRILGKSAQLIRIVAKDQHRLGYWLWLDKETGLLVKSAIITPKGRLLEQIQFTQLEITTGLSNPLQQLAATNLPTVIETPGNIDKNNLPHVKLQWDVTWLPAGFEQIKADRHPISLSNTPVEFRMYTDGLVEVSVYVNKSTSQRRAPDFVYDGATIALNQIINGIEVSIVGKIPVYTAKTIAESIRFTGN
tara:strand:- start:464 stop:1567 length:1104 start_codon:yes stop_codon:yes gene_type:complete